MFDKFFNRKNRSDEPIVTDDGDGAGDFFVWLIALLLMAFTAYRSIHLISSTLPPDAQVLAFAGLAALDGGALGWLAFSSRATGARHGLAILMVAVDLFGVGAAVVADTMLIGGANPELVKTVTIWAVPIVVVANVAATFAAKALDPMRRARADERLRRARIEHERRRVQDEVEAAEREAELAMLRNRAALMRQRSAANLWGQRNGHAKDEPATATLNADGAPDAPRSKSRR